MTEIICHHRVHVLKGLTTVLFLLLKSKVQKDIPKKRPSRLKNVHK